MLQKNIEVKMSEKVHLRTQKLGGTETQPENTLNDLAVEQNRAVLYPTEFLNTLEPSRTSPHRLTDTQD